MADVRLIPTLRVATAADASLLLTWRNDEATRAASITTEAVSPETHAAWLNSSLENPRRFLLIAELAGLGDHAGGPVAMVRFDALDAPATWLVSINLAPAARGRGLAAPVLQAGWHWLAANAAVTAVIAKIRVTNAASIGAFERAGYRLTSTADGWHHYERKGSDRS
jgi:RimJ/RimL family protein N-acetyltransferase